MNFKVDIYLETPTHAPRLKEGKCAWIIEYTTKSGQIVTKNGEVREENTTGNRIHIRALLDSLKCLKPGCEITVHTYCVYLESLVQEWMEMWEKNGWKKSESGEEVKNADLLPFLLVEKNKHRIVFETGGRHIYTEWLKSEMKE